MFRLEKKVKAILCTLLARAEMRKAILEISDDDIVVQAGVADFAGHAYGSRPRTHVSDDVPGCPFRDPGFLL